MRRPSRLDRQARYALREANLAFLGRSQSQRADPITVFLYVVMALAVLAYVVRT